MARRASVDLPLPFGPRSATRSPGARRGPRLAGWPARRAPRRRTSRRSRSGTPATTARIAAAAALPPPSGAGSGAARRAARRRPRPASGGAGQELVRRGRARSGVPSPSRASTRSASGHARSARCSTRTIVVVRASRISASRSAKARAPGGSRLAVGSSRTRRPGWGAKAPASARRCCSPPESRAVRRRSNPARPASARATGTRARIRSRPAPTLQAERDVVLDALHHELARRILEDDSDAGGQRDRIGAADADPVERSSPRVAPGRPTARAPPSPARACSCPSPTARRPAGTTPGARSNERRRPRPRRGPGR